MSCGAIPETHSTYGDWKHLECRPYHALGIDFVVKLEVEKDGVIYRPVWIIYSPDHDLDTECFRPHSIARSVRMFAEDLIVKGIESGFYRLVKTTQENT